MMSLFSIFKGICIYSFSSFVILCLAICFVPSIPPHVNFSSFKVERSMSLGGPLAKNNRLEHAERLYEGHLKAPESMATRNGPDNELYVSVNNGDIVKIWGKDHEHHRVVANLAPNCAGLLEGHICGRPFGMRFGPDGLLYIAESYHGIHTLNVDTGEKVLIIPSSLNIGGRRSLLVDDLDIDGDLIYWSDASSNFRLHEGLGEVLSDPSGRLIRSNMKTGQHEVILPNLHFANGVQLSPKKDFVLVCETFKRRVTRYWTKGSKSGESDIFVSGLPGCPDNLRQRVGGGYLVALVTSTNPDHPEIDELLAKWPTVRKIIIKLAWNFKTFVDYVDSVYPNYLCKTVSYKIMRLDPSAADIENGESMVVEVDENGKVIGSYQGYSGKLKAISQALEIGDYMFFGSPFVDYLGRLKLTDQMEKTKPTQPSKEKPKQKEKKEEL